MVKTNAALSCEECYFRQAEVDRPTVLLLMAIGLNDPLVDQTLQLIGHNSLVLKPTRPQLIDEARRRYSLHKLKKRNFFANRPGTGWNMAQTKKWLCDNPIQGQSNIDFVKRRLSETNYGLGNHHHHHQARAASAVAPERPEPRPPPPLQPVANPAAAALPSNRDKNRPTAYVSSSHAHPFRNANPNNIGAWVLPNTATNHGNAAGLSHASRASPRQQQRQEPLGGGLVGTQSVARSLDGPQKRCPCEQHYYQQTNEDRAMALLIMTIGLGVVCGCDSVVETILLQQQRQQQQSSSAASTQLDNLMRQEAHRRYSLLQIQNKYSTTTNNNNTEKPEPSWNTHQIVQWTPSRVRKTFLLCVK